MERIKILVVEDERTHRELLEEILKEEGFDVVSFERGEAALSFLKNNSADIAILDVRLPGISGLHLLKWIKENRREMEVIIITAFGDVENAIYAIKLGAFHYLTKPYEPEVLLNLVKKCAELISFRKGEEKEIIYVSEKMKRLISQVSSFARSDAPVLILGESGVGKELIARLIHKKSGRKGNFVPVNCSAIPENLFEAELFGYEKGAFTGATTSKKGLIEEAEGGTLFLDEVGEIPLSLQPKLLRFLQEGEFKPLGSNKIKKANVRIISATNRDLKNLVKEGKFREDLYFRLSVIEISIPPLRERPEDIEALCYHFVRKYARKYGKLLEIDKSVIEVLKNYKFPGNVRELENIIHRAVILAENYLTPEHLNLPEREKEETRSKVEEEEIKPLPEAVAELEKNLILKALRKANFVQTRAAKLLGIDEKSLRYKRKKYNI